MLFGQKRRKSRYWSPIITFTVQKWEMTSRLINQNITLIPVITTAGDKMNLQQLTTRLIIKCHQEISDHYSRWICVSWQPDWCNKMSPGAQWQLTEGVKVNLPRLTARLIQNVTWRSVTTTAGAKANLLQLTTRLIEQNVTWSSMTANWRCQGESVRADRQTDSLKVHLETSNHYCRCPNDHGRDDHQALWPYEVYGGWGGTDR